ncbi:site-specific integrase [Mesorhizobium sp. B3-1-9]|uniref:site-specific integrase n=1 Tax=Mesorhizobium sp. B3-1-9 TaxID=2589892 RepID=UPI0015E2B7FC|nr:site-specific integrase [Mesorhizobium sp. B3-1-9]
MAKPLYLVGTGSELKLKRNVPKHLVGLAGKTAWIERISHSNAKTAKDRAGLFAVRTNTELRKLEDLYAHRDCATINEPSALNLDTTRAQQIALWYFNKRDQENQQTGAYLLDPDDPDYNELLDAAAEDCQQAMREASGTMRTTDPRALELLVEHGVLSRSKADQLNASGWPDELTKHPGFQCFCRLIERADLALTNRRYRSWATGSPPRIDYCVLDAASAHIAQPRHLPSAVTGKTLTDLKSAFMAQREGMVTKSRAAQYRLPFRVLEEQLGTNVELGVITRDDARKVADFLPRIPSHATQHHKGCSLTDAAAQHEEATGAPANRWTEAQKHLQVIKFVFDFALNEQWLTSNPWLGIAISIPREQRKKHLSKEATYQTFSIVELNRLFALPLFNGCVDDQHGCHKPGPNIIKRHRYWAPIISLWTGMRMNEILQLEKADFGITETGVRYLHVTDEEHGDYSEGVRKRVKSKSAIRNIPLHPIFEQSGFFEWLDKRPGGRLFPEATAGAGEKPSDVYSKRFRTNLKAAGIWESRRQVFHSLRNNFNDALRAADVPVEFREAINGWQKRKSMDQRYGNGPSIDVLFKHISKVKYPGLSLEFLNKGKTSTHDHFRSRQRARTVRRALRTTEP